MPTALAVGGARVHLEPPMERATICVSRAGVRVPTASVLLLQNSLLIDCDGYIPLQDIFVFPSFLMVLYVDWVVDSAEIPSLKKFHIYNPICEHWSHCYILSETTCDSLR